MKRYTDLEALLQHTWEYLEAGSARASHPARTPTFLTGDASARTIVLREISAEERALLFHTDLRSDKSETLRQEPLVGFHHWNPDRSQQFRLEGRAELHLDDEIADRIWAEQPETAKVHYQKAASPGTPVEGPRSAHPATDDVDGSSEPRSNFAVVRTVVDSIDWLHLHSEGHYRAQFEWTDGEWSGRWVVP